MKKLSFLILVLMSSLLYANKDPRKLENAEFIHLQNGFRVWTKRVGSGPITILTLHGGPGCTHEYLECFEDFFPKDQFQIIFYDQLGSYYSDQPDDLSLWTMDRFCDEIEEVRQGLNIDQFYLYGQSCGGLLAIEYALKYGEHLKGVIISNITASTASYVSYIEKLRSELPQPVQDGLKAYEEKGDYFNPEYVKLMFEEVYARHLCLLKPWPEPLVRTFDHLSLPVYQTIHGPNEFVMTGNYADWNRWNDLSKISTPALLIGAKYDSINPEDMKKMGSLIPNAKVKICENGSHCCHYDDQEEYFKAIHEFLNNH